MSLVSEGMFTLEVSKCFEEAYVCRDKEGVSFNHVISAGLIEKVTNKDVKDMKEYPHRCQRKFSLGRGIACANARGQESVFKKEPGGRCGWRNEELRLDPMFHQII